MSRHETRSDLCGSSRDAEPFAVGLRSCGARSARKRWESSPWHREGEGGDGGAHSLPANDHCKWQWALWAGGKATDGRKAKGWEKGSKYSGTKRGRAKANRRARATPLIPRDIDLV
jgi:hypothetical protein